MAKIEQTPRGERYAIVEIDRKLVNMFGNGIEKKRKFIHDQLEAYIEAAIPDEEVWDKCCGVFLSVRFI